MAITCTWKVVQLETYPNLNGKLDAVCTVHWKLIGEEDDVYFELAGATGLNQTSTEDNFIPYESLTESIVIQWVKNMLGQENTKQYEAAVANEVRLRASPPVIPRELPWV